MEAADIKITEEMIEAGANAVGLYADNDGCPRCGVQGGCSSELMV
jgi:hypothetical protein